MNFREYINEVDEDFEVSKYISTIAKKINPNDKKNSVNIMVTQKSGNTASFVIVYDTLNGKMLSQNDVNTLSSEDQENSERHQINIKKMSKGWKVDTKIKAKGDLAKYSGKLTSEEALEILKGLKI